MVKLVPKGTCGATATEVAGGVVVEVGGAAREAEAVGAVVRAGEGGVVGVGGVAGAPVERPVREEARRRHGEGHAGGAAGTVEATQVLHPGGDREAAQRVVVVEELPVRLACADRHLFHRGAVAPVDEEGADPVVGVGIGEGDVEGGGDPRSRRRHALYHRRAARDVGGIGPRIGEVLVVIAHAVEFRVGVQRVGEDANAALVGHHPAADLEVVRRAVVVGVAVVGVGAVDQLGAIAEAVAIGVLHVDEVEGAALLQDDVLDVVVLEDEVVEDRLVVGAVVDLPGVRHDPVARGGVVHLDAADRRHAGGGGAGRGLAEVEPLAGADLVGHPQHVLQHLAHGHARRAGAAGAARSAGAT